MSTSNLSAAVLVERLRASADPENLAGMARFGISTESAFGNTMPTIRAIAREAGRNHELALALWDTGIHDARLLAVFVDDPREVTVQQMDRWAAGFNSWDLTDQCCNHLFRKANGALDRIPAWAEREEEFVRRAAFAMIASFAVHAKKLPDAQFLDWLSLIRAASHDERNFVKKAVNWALRQIGKRSITLHARAVALAEELAGLPSKSARWIAKDALRELQKPETVERISRRSI